MLCSLSGGQWQLEATDVAVLQSACGTYPTPLKVFEMIGIGGVRVLLVITCCYHHVTRQMAERGMLVKVSHQLVTNSSRSRQCRQLET